MGIKRKRPKIAGSAASHGAQAAAQARGGVLSTPADSTKVAVLSEEDYRQNSGTDCQLHAHVRAENATDTPIPSTSLI